MELIKEREKVASFMRRLYDQKLTTASGGNVSMRVNDYVLITPSQSDKAMIISGHIVILNMEGKPITPRHKKSMESEMHLLIYRMRPDVKAIIHAHPVITTSFVVSGKSMKTNFTGESWFVLGEPVEVPYALMGTVDLAKTVSEATRNTNVVLMKNHGVITLGNTLFQAYDRMEVLEACAKMNLITGILGSKIELTPEQLQEITNL